MLGHKLTQLASLQADTFCTFREKGFSERYADIFRSAHCIAGITAQDLDSVSRAFATAKPSVVVNCIGIVKQIERSFKTIANIEVNALFPHRLFQLCEAAGVRLILLSTDCVFSGKNGNYVESDLADAQDVYGRSKLLGEIDREGCLTIRTSMIGRQLEESHALLEWFLNQNGKSVNGYKKAIFSGFPTNELAKIILKIILDFPGLHGVRHIAAPPISKFDLLTLIKERYELNIDIRPDETVHIDRSLDDSKFRDETGMPTLDWPCMIADMHADPTRYIYKGIMSATR